LPRLFLALKLVLDTQIWLDWLVFDDPAVRPLRNAVHLGRAQIVIDAACDAELERVLAYDLGKHSISPQAQLAALDQARRLAHRVEIVALKGLPQCRDPDDQKFIQLAAATNADALVTKDRELLRLKRQLPFRVVRLEELSISGSR
jgi:putative PIN family toxin of toxin-antitoxin system